MKFYRCPYCGDRIDGCRYCRDRRKQNGGDNAQG